ncbi:MAG TPA: FAD-dependent oxidoreductase [Streptosporangiaceae bacterium]|nr:FAD-dependent oxidoreductase [Streptosporangiaceae bacterium]
MHAATGSRQRAGGLTDRPRAAVVGAGVSGLTAAYLLQRRYDVTLYEADGRLGGHADTREVPTPDGRLLPLDTGFLVHNTRTYPTLTRLFRELGVQSRETEMSLSVRCQGCGLEYAGSRGMRGLIPGPGQLVRPGYLRMLATVPGFYRAARRLLQAGSGSPDLDTLTLGDFLTAGGYDRYFTGHFVAPLVAAVWSCSPGDARAYPARYLFEFLDNHGMLTLGRVPSWRTVVGGSKTYVEQIAKQITSVRSGVPVRAVRRAGGGVEVTDANGEAGWFDAAVVATHPDQALAVLAAPALAEREVLGAFSYSTSEVALHTDESLLPRSPAVRSSWNYLLSDCAGSADEVHVSYYLNRLQRLSEPTGYVVTLNTLDQVRPELVVDRMRYEHPLYTRRSVAAQRRLGELNSGVLAYAGAYQGWGFHEDGCRSAVTAAGSLGVTW